MELRRSTSCGLRGHGCSPGISVVAIVTALLMLAAAVRTGRALYRRMELSGASNDNDAWRRRLPEGFHGVATLLLLPMRSWKDFIIARLLSVRWRWLCETIQLGLWIAVLVFSVAEIVVLCWPMLDHVANGQMPAAALSLTHGSSLVQTPQTAPPKRPNLPSAAKISSAARGRIAAPCGARYPSWGEARRKRLQVRRKSINSSVECRVLACSVCAVPRVTTRRGKHVFGI